MHCEIQQLTRNYNNDINYTYFTSTSKNNHNINWEVKMGKWECSVCGYIYDPEKGDPDNGVEPGTPFESLPDDWVCPSCGAGKDLFDELD